jgi:FkbM family methyltransferase
MDLKSFIRSIVRKSGYDVVRFAPELVRPFPVLPLLVRERIASCEQFFFIQVGANDGVLDDPLYDLVRQYHLPGLLIEPLPDLFEKLRDNYKEEPQLIFENVAILGHDGTVSMHRVRSDAEVPRHWHGIASFQRANLLAQGVPSAHIETLTVKGTSLHFLITKHDIQRISLLQIDTEGYDYEVIKSALEAKIFPEIISYEHCWLLPATRYKCKRILDSHGYQFVEVGKDTLAVRTVT